MAFQHLRYAVARCRARSHMVVLTLAVLLAAACSVIKGEQRPCCGKPKTLCNMGNIYVLLPAQTPDVATREYPAHAPAPHRCTQRAGGARLSGGGRSRTGAAEIFLHHQRRGGARGIHRPLGPAERDLCWKHCGADNIQVRPCSLAMWCSYCSAVLLYVWSTTVLPCVATAPRSTVSAIPLQCLQGR